MLRLTLLQSARQKLAAVVGANLVALNAVKALTAPGFPTEKGLCQMWVRLVVESVYRRKFAGFFAGSARETGLRFIGSKYQVHNGSLPGDLLYQTNTERHGPNGHVGIRIYGNMVAQNSSRWEDDQFDARGICTLEEFGKVDVVVRPSN